MLATIRKREGVFGSRPGARSSGKDAVESVFGCHPGELPGRGTLHQAQAYRNECLASMHLDVELRPLVLPPPRP